jgi:hypothetical protein
MQPAVGGLWEIRTLSGWGARYTEKKARREVMVLWKDPEARQP